MERMNKPIHFNLSCPRSQDAAPDGNFRGGILPQDSAWWSGSGRMNSPRGLRPLRAAFSLIELLLVMSIIALLASASILAVQGITSGRNITLAGSMVLDQMSLAQQTALTKNTRVRWQIVEVPDNRTGEDESYRLIRLQIFEPSNRTWRTLNQQLLPISISADARQNFYFSTLLKDAHQIDDLTYDGQRGASAAASSIVFLPNGRTSLNPSAIYSLTLHNPRKTNDFITIQVNPVSGRTRTFRP
jgi:uncharacterized protein (TIGR02596 family)